MIPYEKIFDQLPSLGDNPTRKSGHPAYSKDVILRALIYKNLRGLPSLSELAFELKNNPALAETLVFSARLAPLSIERFSFFLRETKNETFQALRHLIVARLIKEKVISGKIVAMDSCAIEANVRENNLKTAVTDRFDKKRQPKGDPDARLGIKIYYPKPFQRKTTFFWGYRNHILTDAHSELPLHEKTLPVDHDEKKQALPFASRTDVAFSIASRGSGS